MYLICMHHVLTDDIASRFKNKGFTFIALNPGWVNTDLAGEGKGAIVSTFHFGYLVLFCSCADADLKAPLQPEQSIRQCVNFVYRSSPNDSGKFFSLDGQINAVTH